MKWPRGKYNGRRIVGFSIKMRLMDTLQFSFACMPLPTCENPNNCPVWIKMTAEVKP